MINKKYELVNFSEIDKFAIKSYCAIHNVNPDKNLGDVCKVDENKIEKFNCIFGGSPCQDFSIAGHQKGSEWKCENCGYEYNPIVIHYSNRHICPKCGGNQLDKSRSSLLVEWLRIIRANKPNWGIYENVKNITGKKFKETFDLFISELEEYGYNVYWQILDAQNYGVPQHRERVYVIIIKKELDNGKFKIPEPFESDLKLRDVLEDEVDQKYYVNSETAKKLIGDLAANGTLEKEYNRTVSRTVRRGGVAVL